MATLFLDETPVTLDNGIQGIPWQVETADPATFHELINASGTLASTIIFAQSFLPLGVKNPPCVVVVPGSLGVAPSHVYKAEILTNAGFAACVIDPFGNRGVSSTVANQAQYSFAASAWDVIATILALRQRGEVDNKRIGAQGHSRGGSAILSAAALQRLIGHNGLMAGIYAAYPWCGQQFLNPRVGDTTVRSVVGDQDEWCSPQQVQSYMQALRLTGAQASWKIFAGAHHSFDRGTELENVPDASVAPGAPTIFINDDGSMIHPATGIADPDASERDLMLYGIKAGYGVRGAKLGTTGNQADLFHQDMMEFWQDCFLN